MSPPSLRFAWVGFHAEGLPALDALLAAGAPINAVLTLTPDLAAQGFNHIGDLTWDGREGGRLLLPLE